MLWPAGPDKVLGMTLSLLIGAGIALLHWGLHLPLGLSIVITLAGVGYLGGRTLWTGRRNKVVIVQDLTTGKAEFQPMDAATKRYLSTRKDNEEA